jgi:predicted Na+-dependent transporter
MSKYFINDNIISRPAAITIRTTTGATTSAVGFAITIGEHDERTSSKIVLNSVSFHLWGRVMNYVTARLLRKFSPQGNFCLS